MKTLLIAGLIIVLVIVLMVLYREKLITPSATVQAAFTPICTGGMCGVKGYTRQRSVLQNMLEMSPLSFNYSQ